jgi:hypothetical protein
LNVTEDDSGPLGLALDQTIAAKGINVSSNGVGTDGVSNVVYVISPTKAVLITLGISVPEVFIIQR